MKSLTDNELREHIRGERLKVAGKFRTSARDFFLHQHSKLQLQKLSDTISQCCSRAETFSLHNTDPAQDKVGARRRCRNRHCPFCHAVDGSRVAAALCEIFTDELAKGSQLAMLTLTIRHKKGEPTKLVRKDLDSSWFAFTKRAPFKNIICEGSKGGAYHRVAECELSRANGPHPHFHLGLKVREEARKPYLQKHWREGTLQKLPLWRVYVRFLKRQRDALCTKAKATRAAQLAEIKRDTEKLEKGTPGIGRARKELRARRTAARAAFTTATAAAWALHEPRESRFVTMPPTLLEALLRDDWLQVTAKRGRPSYAVRLTLIRPGKQAGYVQKRWRDDQGKPRKIEITVQKLVQEFTKYITKKQATGRKAGQLGLMDYSADQLLDYVRGVKNWHMHQSSANWAAAAEAAAQEDALLAEAEDAANECRTIPYLELVRQAMLAIDGKLNDDGLLRFERDGLRCLTLLEKDQDNDQEQTLALRSHLARMFGAVNEPLIAFPLALVDCVRIVRDAKDKEWGEYFRQALKAKTDQMIQDYRERTSLAKAADRATDDRLADEAASRFAGTQETLFAMRV